MNIACKFEWGISPYNINALSSNKMDIVVPLGAMIPSLNGGGSVNGVESVNGKTGKHIALEASDLDTYTRSEIDARIPTKLSDLGNDVDFITEVDVDIKLEGKQDVLPTSGDGTKCLSDDGTYKEIQGGGGMSMTVIEYDPTDPANYISQALTLADFVSVDGSAVIDAANNQISVGTPIDVYIQTNSQNSQYIAAKLDKIPHEGTIRLDFSNYADYSLGLFTKPQGLLLDDFVSQLLFSSWQSYQPLQPASVIVNTLNETLSDMFHLKSKINNPPADFTSTEETIENIASLPNLNMTFTISNMLEYRLAEYGMTYQQLVDAVKTVMGYSEEEAIAYVEAQRAMRALISGSLYMIIPEGVTEMYIVLLPKPSDQPATIDPTWVASVEMNTSYISEWKVPDDVDDGTYLIINGQCTLLGHNCTLGDVVQVYDNATKGLLFKRAAV